MFRSSRSCFEHIRCISVRPFHSHCKRHFCSHHRMHLKDRSFTQCEQSASRKRQSKNLRRCEQSNHSSDWRVEIATQTLQLHLICHVSAPAVPHLCIFWLSHCVLVCVCVWCVWTWTSYLCEADKRGWIMCSTSVSVYVAMSPRETERNWM